MSHVSWSGWAEEHLRGHWREAISTALQRSEGARWHPNGFIVFRLGDVEGEGFCGSHRVHIWPGGIVRRTLPGHPTIHSHDWELESLVLSGRYTDVIFERTAQAPSLLAHAVQYGGESGDSVEPTGESVNLVQRDMRTVDPGTCHHMDVGVPHETLVPHDETVVTYVMMGPRHEEGMLLAATAPFTVVGFHRQGLAEEDLEFANVTLEALLGD